MPKIYYTKTEHKIANILSIVSIILTVALITLSAYVEGENNNTNNKNNTDNLYYNEFDNVKLGEIIQFGKYEQDNNEKNGPEDIKWIVLKIQDNKALIISKYALDSKQYDTEDPKGQLWEYSSLRYWLNTDFIDTAFTYEEKIKISPILTSPYQSTDYIVSSPSSLENNDSIYRDSIFLLNMHDMEKYFPDEESRKCEATKYASANGVEISKTKNRSLCQWWIRPDEERPSYIDFDGIENSPIIQSLITNVGVRPAMWIDIEPKNQNNDFINNDNIDSSIYKDFDNLNPGEIIKFGKYEQDNNEKNGPEDIKWIVLDVQEDKALVISKYALDCIDYHDRGSESWDKCKIRDWLNIDFMYTAFSNTEIAKIHFTTSESRPLSGISNSSCTDQVFLLGIDEIKKYFPEERLRVCETTAYAKSRGVETKEKSSNCRWWILSTKYKSYCINFNGVSDKYDPFINHAGVRPTMWIDTNYNSILN